MSPKDSESKELQVYQEPYLLSVDDAIAKAITDPDHQPIFLFDN
jgi:hypothetical protein